MLCVAVLDICRGRFLSSRRSGFLPRDCDGIVVKVGISCCAFPVYGMCIIATTMLCTTVVYIRSILRTLMLGAFAKWTHERNTFVPSLALFVGTLKQSAELPQRRSKWRALAAQGVRRADGAAGSRGGRRRSCSRLGLRIGHQRQVWAITIHAAADTVAWERSYLFG